jgi:hypothetical protein
VLRVATRAKVKTGQGSDTGLNAENRPRPLAKVEVFSLDIPFYRTADQPFSDSFRFARDSGNVGQALILFRKQ